MRATDKQAKGLPAGPIAKASEGQRAAGAEVTVRAAPAVLLARRSEKYSTGTSESKFVRPPLTKDPAHPAPMRHDRIYRRSATQPYGAGSRPAKLAQTTPWALGEARKCPGRCTGRNRSALACSEQKGMGLGRSTTERLINPSRWPEHGGLDKRMAGTGECRRLPIRRWNMEHRCSSAHKRRGKASRAGADKTYAGTAHQNSNKRKAGSQEYPPTGHRQPASAHQQERSVGGWSGTYKKKKRLSKGQIAIEQPWSPSQKASDSRRTKAESSCLRDSGLAFPQLSTEYPISGKKPGGDRSGKSACRYSPGKTDESTTGLGAHRGRP